MLYTQIVKASGRSIQSWIEQEYSRLTDDIAAVSHMTFGRVRHRRGNSAGA